MEGAIDQVPPAVSALKVGGVPSYRRVLRGQTIELAPRRVRIDWIFVHAYDWPTIDFSMSCGRGTYVRSVIRDLGAALGVGGCLTGLARLRVGPFAIEDAWTVEAMEAAPGPEAYVIPLDEAARRLDSAAIVIPPRPV
jgi:tRNA pseudouridine55 synthase